MTPKPSRLAQAALMGWGHGVGLFGLLSLAWVGCKVAADARRLPVLSVLGQAPLRLQGGDVQAAAARPAGADRL